MVVKRARSWAYTLNNYDQKDVTHLHSLFPKGGTVNYVMQEEVGTEGTPHLQGCIRFKEAKTFATIKKIYPKAHWEQCKNWLASIRYCTKEDTREGEIYSNWNYVADLPVAAKKVKDPLEGKDLFMWQQDIIDIITEVPDDRKIYWYYEEVGNRGKTSLAKSLCLKNKDCIYVSGKASDIKYAIATMKQKPKTVIWDIPRCSQEYISWEGIESIKNGIFFSNKYESGMVMYDCPHIICLANFEPDKTKLSLDRWVIVAI